MSNETCLLVCITWGLLVFAVRGLNASCAGNQLGWGKLKAVSSRGLQSQQHLPLTHIQISLPLYEDEAFRSYPPMHRLGKSRHGSAWAFALQGSG